MSDSSALTYLLPRTSHESNRLDDQHRVLLASTQSFAHSSLGNLNQFKCILDNGTGTAIWPNTALAGGIDGVPVDLGPDVIVEGADVSSDQFPPLERRHPRLGELYVHDVVDPFPPEKLGRYDLIHQRLLVAALTTKQWPIAIRNLYEALQPGGYLSALDANLEWHREGVQDQDLPECLRLANRMSVFSHEQTGKPMALGDDMAGMMREAGFVDIQATPIKWWFGRELKRTSTRIYIEFLRAIVPHCLKFGGFDGLRTIADAEKMLQECEVEVLDTPIYLNLVAAVGIRPQ